MILNKAIAAKLPANEMVKTIFIFSDMEFDDCGGKQYETDFMLIQRKFAESGYPSPGNLFYIYRKKWSKRNLQMSLFSLALVCLFYTRMAKREDCPMGEFDNVKQKFAVIVSPAIQSGG